MTKKHFLIGLILLIAVLFFAACAPSSNAGGSLDAANETAETAPPRNTPKPRPTVAMSLLRRMLASDIPLAAEVDIVLDEMHAPVAIAIAPDGRIFFTEKDTGNIRVAIDGVIQPEPVINLPVGAHGEQGMLGIVLDPDFENNHYIWFSHTLPARANEGEKVNRVLRFKEVDNIATDVQVAYESPNSSGDGTHNLNNMVFGPDGMLYITIGDDAQGFLSQNLGDPRGKIHRFMPTIPLTVPGDNPFYDGDGPNEDSIYVRGVRNSFDFVLDPFSEELRFFATENGPDCDDEINLILPGYNYGWHNLYDCEDPDRMLPEINTIPPMLVWDETNSPTGITVYTGDDFPEWYGDVFFCTYDGVLHHMKLNETRDAFRLHRWYPGMFCQTDVLNGPDGSLYFLEGGGYYDGTLKRIYNKLRQ